MCLALPALVVERDGDNGSVLLGDARMKVNLCLLEEARPGDWVLVHAGFAIERLTEEEARETFDILEALE